MKRQKPGSSGGFTIIELMIVLAVTGFMLAIAQTAIGGKVDSDEFITGVDQLGATIQNTADDVNDGQFNNNGTGCSIVGGDPTIVTTNGADTQGTNSNCIYLGKLVHFWTGANNGEYYEVFTIIGCRDQSQQTDGTETCNSYPDYHAAVDTQSPGDSDDLTLQGTTPDHLNVISVSVTPDGSPVIPTGNNIAFFNTQTLDSSSNSLGTTGSGQEAGLAFMGNGGDIGVGGVPASIAGETAAVSTINGGNVTFAQSASICVSDGTRYAEINIGTDEANDVTSPIAVSVQKDLSSCPY